MTVEYWHMFETDTMPRWYGFRLCFIVVLPTVPTGS